VSAAGKIFVRRDLCNLLASAAQLVTAPDHALAVIDGTLCQLAQNGTRSAGHVPLATAVIEFHRGPMCYYVREHPCGLLPGIPNLYCLDGSFRLQWMADWPSAEDPCIGIVGRNGDVLVVTSASGAEIRLEAHTGRLLSVVPAMAATG